MRNNIPYSMSSNTVSVELTRAEYDNLSYEEKMNGTVYYVTDEEMVAPDNVRYGFTPVGTIIALMGNHAPKNYLYCNGAIKNISDYPELAHYFEKEFGEMNHFGGDGITTFAVPDLRGEFLRGAGTNGHSGEGSGTSVGAHQAGTAIPNIYLGTSIGLPITYGKGIGVVNGDLSMGTPSTTYYFTNSSAAGSGTVGSTYPQVKIRPTNTSVFYAIATKDIYLSPENDYSTNEKVVGTWIDGKPLYQRTIAVTVPTTTADYTAVTSDNIRIANNASLKCYDGYYIYIDGSSRNNICMFDRYYALPSDTRVMYTMLLSGGNEDMFRIRNNRTAANGLQGYVTCKYTKTTD